MEKHAIRKALVRLSWAGAAFALAACDSGSATGGSGSGPLHAKVDGAAWEAEPIGTYATALASSPGCLLIGGSQTSGGTTTSLTLTLYNVKDTGTYALGTGLTATGGMGQVGEGSGGGGKGNGWITAGTGLDGQIRITRLGAGHITADFNYTAAPGKSNTLTADKVVTEGHVDLDYTGTLAPVADKDGGTLTATLGGKAYNAADIYANLTDINGNAGVTINTITSENAVSISLAGVTAAGTYAVIWKQPTPRSIVVGHNGGTAETCCWGAEGDSAEVTITSLTAHRVKGSFHGILVPQAGRPAKSPLTVTDGAFDVGIP